MLEKIKIHLGGREDINKGLRKIIKHCGDDEDSPIEILEGDWSIEGDSLHIQEGDTPLDEDYYSYTISSLGAKGEELFMGEKDGYTYVMAHPEDGSWSDTTIFVLNNKNQIFEIEEDGEED